MFLTLDEMFDRDRRCVYCRRTIARENATIDHIVPLSQGGNDQSHNRVLCCRRCNQAKGDFSLEQWISMLILAESRVNKRHIWEQVQGVARCTQCHAEGCADNIYEECPARDIRTIPRTPKARRVRGNMKHIWVRRKGGKYQCTFCGVMRKRREETDKPCRGTDPRNNPIAPIQSNFNPR